MLYDPRHNDLRLHAGSDHAVLGRLSHLFHKLCRDTCATEALVYRHWDPVRLRDVRMWRSPLRRAKTSLSTPAVVGTMSFEGEGSLDSCSMDSVSFQQQLFTLKVLYMYIKFRPSRKCVPVKIPTKMANPPRPPPAPLPP